MLLPIVIVLPVVAYAHSINNLLSLNSVFVVEQLRNRVRTLIFYWPCTLQRAWLLKLLAVELHSADPTDPAHSEACQSILSELFEPKHTDYGTDHPAFSYINEKDTRIATTGPSMKSKVVKVS